MRINYPFYGTREMQTSYGVGLSDGLGRLDSSRKGLWVIKCKFALAACACCLIYALTPVKSTYPANTNSAKFDAFSCRYSMQLSWGCFMSCIYV